MQGSPEKLLKASENVGLVGAARLLFCHALNNVKVTLSVDVVTGEAKIVAIDDREVVE